MRHLNTQESRVLLKPQCSLAHVTEMANKIYHDTILYKTDTNLIDITKFTSNDTLSTGKAFKVNDWDPPSNR